ncbi:MAG: hypothetical protein RQ760_00845 [Sedimentisphaerales bacterium]|nr:hypothetical protein [Sedimentisphaerales bacterium]
MPLHIKSIAVTIAVACYFGVSFIGLISGLTPFTCCKRALVAAVLAYIAATWAVRGVNAIVVSAMVTDQMNEQEEKDSDDSD